MNTTIHSNEQWDALCALTTELFPQHGARPAALAAACRQRPDLAGAAIDPTGAPVIPRGKALAGSQAAVASNDGRPETSAVVKVAEARAAAFKAGRQ